MATDPAMKITPPYTPELLPEVKLVIEKFLLSRRSLLTGPQRVLELGSGWSTVWFASMSSVTSLEHDSGWADQVSIAIRSTRLDNTLYLTPPEEFADVVGDLPKQHFDLILIDCVDEARMPSLIPCCHRLKPDGWLVIDDTHWQMFDDLPTRMLREGFGPPTRINGKHARKTGEVKFHQTDIYTRSER